MRLRTKTLVTIGLAMFALFVLLSGGAFATLTLRYKDMERIQVQTTGRQTADAVLSEVAGLAEVAEAWASRNDTYAYMKAFDPGYLPQDFSAESLARRGFNFVIFLDENGKPVYSTAIDLDVEEQVAAPHDLIKSIEAATYLRAPGDPRGGARGLMNLPEGVAAVASHSITSGDLYAPPRGTLVIGRYLDSSAMSEMSGTSDLAFVGLTPPKSTPNPATISAKGTLGRQATWGEPASSSLYYVYTQFDDMRGDPVLVVRSQFQRDVRRSIQSAIVFAGVSLFIVAVVATGTGFALMDRIAIRRVEGLSSQVRAIGLVGDSSRRVATAGEDEIAELAASVNGMLVSLEVTERELMSAKDDLERRVDRRTRELFLSDARHRELIERMADAVFSVDLAGCVVLVNQQAVELLGRSRDSLIGCRFVDLMTVGSADKVSMHLEGELDPEGSWTVEALLNSLGRDPVPVELRAAPFTGPDGKIGGTQWIARDITDRQRFEQQLVHLATHDALTDLTNRRAFETALEFELAEAMRGGEPGAVLWLDLDDFKDINDTLGHAAGDEALVMLATVLKRNTRASNLLSRVGGDEFAILMPRTERKEAEMAAERILNGITGFTCAVRGHSVRFGASVGVVFFPEDGSTVAEVLSNADAAMYRAKEGGRSQVYVSTGGDESEHLHVSRIKWNERITRALQEDSFIVCAQPILDLRTREVVRHELLIRMQGAAGKVYPPSDFLPVAERLGLINDIDHWMLRRAIELLESDESGLQAVEVNLSGKAFGDSTIVSSVASLLERSSIDPGRLGFEITETAAIADISRAQWFISGLKELGCRFSLDDFGTGFSSFYYLKHLPVDCLKIDGSYVRGLASSEQDRCLVRGIREMCRGLGVEVLAECIEDEDALQTVISLGLEYAQGYHIGRPAPVRESGLVGGVES